MFTLKRGVSTKDRGGSGSSRQTPGPSPFPDEHGDSGLRRVWAEGSCGARTEDGWPCSLGAKGTLNSEGVISAASFCIWLFCLLQAKQCLPLLPLPTPFCARLSLESQFVFCGDILFLILKLLNDRSEPSELPT